jgi:hypothetical protein
MPKKVFRRGGGGGPNEPISVATSALNQQRREIVEPGDYSVTIEQARLVKNRAGNVSVVLELREPETDALIKLRPLWIHGANADRGTFAADNVGIIQDLLDVAGHAPGTYSQINDSLLATLVGWVFDVQLILQPGATGEMFNAITAVEGGEKSAVAPLRTPAAE